MKAKVKNFFNHPIISALLFNLGVMCVLMLIACPKFSTDIDILMQSILYGISGGGIETHLIYSNILFGKALKELLLLAPGVAWYAVAQFVLVCFGLFSMTYVFLRRPSNLLGRLILLFFLCFAGYECYITPSYLKTATVLCVAAFCMLADAMTDREKSKVRYIWCAVLFWFSSLISFRIFLFVAIICLAGILILYIGKKKIKIGAFGIVTVIVAAALVVGSQGFDSYKYSSDATYTAEKENAKAIEKMYTFGYASYSDEVEELTGLDEDEYASLTSGRFLSYNDDVTDYFPIVAGIGRQVNAQNVLKFFRTVPIRMFQYAIFFCCVILVALAYLSNRKNKRIIVLPIVLWLASYLALYFGNAWSGSVVRLIVLLPICALTLTQLEELPNRYLRGFAAFTCIFALIMYSNFHSKLVTSVKTDSIEEDYMGRWVPEKTYAIDAVAYLKQYSIFQVYPEGLFDKDNICIVNGIYRDVHGFEINEFLNDKVLEKEVFSYNGKMAEDILIE